MPMKFNIGDHVDAGDDTGFITFVCPQYFTLCVKQWDDPDKLHGYSQVNVLIYRNDWPKCTITRRVDTPPTTSDVEGA